MSAPTATTSNSGKKTQQKKKNTSAAQQTPPQSGAAANHTIYGVEATAAAGTIATFTGAPGWWGTAAAVGTIAATTAYQRKAQIEFPNQVRNSDAGRSHQRSNLDPNATFAGVTTAAAGGYATACAADILTPWTVEGLGLLGVTAAALGPVYSYLRARNDRRNAAQVAEMIEQKELRQRSEWESILAEAGMADTTIADDISDANYTNGKRTFPAGFALLLRLGKKAPGIKMLSNHVDDVERVAENILGQAMFPGSVEFSRVKGSSAMAEIRVATRDILAETFHSPDDDDLTNPRSINDGIRLGREIDGTEMVLDLMDDPHGLIAGSTNAGKSVFVNQHAYEAVAMPDAAIWMIAGNKATRTLVNWMWPFFNGWLSPVTGQPVNPALDWVAGTWEEACRVLLDAYKAVDVRQTSAMETGEEKWVPSPDRPRILILIDESPDLLDDDRKVGTTHKGETNLTLAELLLKVIRLGRSEGISVIFLSQRATNTMLGSEGGDMRSQISYRGGLKSSATSNEENSVFASDTNHIDLSQLEPGQVYVEMGGFAQPKRIKAYYNDPSMIRARAQHAAHLCRPIDRFTSDELDFYAGRWTRQEQVEFFTGNLCPNPVRTNPAEPVTPKHTADGALHEAAQTGTSVLDRPGADGDPTTPGDTWWRDLDPDQFAAFLNTCGFTADDGDPGDDRIRAALEAAHLEELWNLPEADEPETAPAEPTGPEFNPELPDDTRQLLYALCNHPVMLAGYNIVSTEEIVRICHDTLGWDATVASTSQRIKTALDAVSVSKPRGKKTVKDADGNPVDGSNGKPLRVMGYLTSDLQAAIDTQRVDLDTGDDESDDT